MTRCFVLASLTMASLACTRPNPAFDDGGGESVASAEASGSTSAPETSDSADTLDGQDTSDTTTNTDPSETSTSETDTTETGEEPLCTQQPRGSLRLVVNSPLHPCPENVNEWFVRVPAAGLNSTPGIATGIQCSEPTCNLANCAQAAVSFGAPDLPEVIDLWTLLGGLLNDTGYEALCIEVAAIGKLTDTNSECTYGALGLYDRSIENGPVFIGQIDETPWTWVATQALGEEPLVRDLLETCTCESLFGDNPNERGCCELVDIEPSFYTLSLFDTVVPPGDATNMMIGSIPWRFRVKQAQTVTSCENMDGLAHDAWALTRVQ